MPPDTADTFQTKHCKTLYKLHKLVRLVCFDMFGDALVTASTVPLGELAEVVSGGTPKRSESSYFGGDVPWVKIGDMLQGTVMSTQESITHAGLTRSSAKLLPAGTLLLSIFATIGRTAVLGIDAATNQAIAGLIIRDPSRVNRNYLRRYLEFASEQLARQGRGVAQANINLSILRKHNIPLPPIEEQRWIAGVLDAADELRAKRRQILAKLDLLVHAVFFDMFGDDKKTSVWQDQRLGDVCELKYGKSLPQAKRSGSGFGVFGSNGQIGLHNETLTKGATIIVGRKGSFGEVTLSYDRCWPIDTAYYVDESTTRADLRWLYYRMKAMPLTLLNRAAAVPGLNREDAYNQRLLLPPIKEQRRFGEIADEVDALRGKHRESLVMLDTLFGSLQQRAFRGEL